MGRIMKFLRAIFLPNPARELEAVVRELGKLSENIKPLLVSTDWCAALVSFFGLVSPWHDRGLYDLADKLEQVNWRGQHNWTIKQLYQLQFMFRHAGRNMYGMNRTKRGEVVTEDNVYLGGVFGVWTFTVAQFRKGRDEPKNPWKGGIWDDEYLKDKNTLDMVSDYQARPFVQEHGKAIIEAVQALRNPVHSKVS